MTSLRLGGRWMTRVGAGAVAVAAVALAVGGNASSRDASRPSRSGLAFVDPEPTGASASAGWAHRPSSTVADALRRERVLLIGDSLMNDSATAFDAAFDSLGVTHLAVAHPGSGLFTSYGIWHWPTVARDLVVGFRPTVVVVELCCNYFPPRPTDAAGRPVAPGTPAFSVRWGAEAKRIARVLTSGGARLHWVLTPPSNDPVRNRTLIDPINATTVANAADGRPDIHLLDWIGPLTDGTGRYRDAIATLVGPVRVRSDGLHLTAAGAEVAVQVTVAALLADEAARRPRRQPA